MPEVSEGRFFERKRTTSHGIQTPSVITLSHPSQVSLPNAMPRSSELHVGQELIPKSDANSSNLPCLIFFSIGISGDWMEIGSIMVSCYLPKKLSFIYGFLHRLAMQICSSKGKALQGSKSSAQRRHVEVKTQNLLLLSASNDLER